MGGHAVPTQSRPPLGRALRLSALAIAAVVGVRLGIADAGVPRGLDGPSVPAATATVAPPDADRFHPAPPRDDPIHLPVLRTLDDQPVCDSWVAVQNVGGEPGKAVLVTWAESVLCAPHCQGPIAAECSALLSPGQGWWFEDAQLPLAAKSGVVFSFNARRLSDLGSGVTGPGLVADLMCQVLAREVVGDCDAYRRFASAFESGTAYAGIPLARAYGPALVAEAHRTCPGAANKAADASSTYRGVAGRGFGGRDRIFDVSSYHATLLSHRAGAHSVLYVQNGGARCASVDVWLQARDACDGPTLCQVFTLEQGTSLSVRLDDCIGPEWTGSAWLRSSEPLAIAVDVLVGDARMTYTAVPSDLRYAWDGPPEFTAGSAVAYGPVITAPPADWGVGVHVQNLSSVKRASVAASFFAPNGTLIGEVQEAWICPRGTSTFALGTKAVDERAPEVGLVRVESLPWEFEDRQPPLPPRPIPGPNISALAVLTRGPAWAPTGAMAYTLLPESLAFDWPSGNEPGIGLIAVPGLSRGGSGATGTRLALANLVPYPGHTDVVLLLYDQNGLIAARCERLAEHQVEHIDLDRWPALNGGFRGSGLVSAVVWDHRLPGDGMSPGRNTLGLAALTLQRDAGATPDGRPGDAYGGETSAPVPLSRRGPNVGFEIGPPETLPCLPTRAPKTPVAAPTALPLHLPLTAR